MLKQSSPRRPAAWPVCIAIVAGLAAGAAHAQHYPITPTQRSTAEQVAHAGVPLSELAPNAPDQYTIKRGDTLWGISGMYLKSPWRWPELWGMNMEAVHNPHLIYPGQVLVLEKVDGMALLRLRGEGGGNEPIDTVRVSPRVRVEPLPDAGAIPMLQPNVIEPFLAEPLIIDEAALKAAPRIVGVPEDRVLLTRGDRAYARGLAATPLMLKTPGRVDTYRIFRNAKPITHPVTGALLGYEAAYLGRAELVRSESSQVVPHKYFLFTKNETTVVPATIDIVSAKEEVSTGDRLLPEPPRQFLTYAPHAPAAPTSGTIVSVYGDAVSIAGQNQVVLIDKGTADGVDNGTVLAILKTGEHRRDITQDGEHANIKLPDERNGLMMVFRPFEHLSYALILDITDTVQVGDRVASPR
ncbi:MAG TPA: LysM domain-containing protein [Ramlibacter sp.]|jgi:hypothetical protein|nr:LysM domain-containing protein [Ramlibacter sp.]